MMTEGKTRQKGRVCVRVTGGTASLDGPPATTPKSETVKSLGANSTGLRLRQVLLSPLYLPRPRQRQYRQFKSRKGRKNPGLGEPTSHRPQHQQQKQQQQHHHHRFRDCPFRGGPYLCLWGSRRRHRRNRVRKMWTTDTRQLGDTLRDRGETGVAVFL